MTTTSPAGPAGVPGPASLVANAIAAPKVSPLQPTTSVDGATPESQSMSRSTSVESVDRPELYVIGCLCCRTRSELTLSRAVHELQPLSPPFPSLSHSKGAQELSPPRREVLPMLPTNRPSSPPFRSFTHVGTSKVDTSFRKADGSVTLRPIADRGTVLSQIKSKRHRSRFTARTSHFDRNNSASAKDQFRGFYTLFWIMLALSAARTGVRNWYENGTPFGTAFARLITEDGWTLAFSDGVMVVSTFLCVPFAQVRVTHPSARASALTVGRHRCLTEAGFGIGRWEPSFSIFCKPSSSLRL